MNNNVIKNGQANSNTGFRQVLVDSNFNLCPVLYKIFSGYRSDRCTVQVSPKKGDYLFAVSWNSSLEFYTIHQYIDDNGSSVELYDSSLWKRLNPEINDFIDPVGRGESYLPEHLYGMTLSEKNKRKALNEFFKSYHLTDLKVDEFINSPKQGLNLIPKKFEGDVNNIIPQYNSHIGSMVNIDRKELWYAIVNHTTIKLDCDYEGKHGSNYAYDKQYSEKGKPLSIPQNTKYLIKVVDGAYTKDHFSKGKTIDIYSL